MNNNLHLDDLFVTELLLLSFCTHFHILWSVRFILVVMHEFINTLRYYSFTLTAVVWGSIRVCVCVCVHVAMAVISC